MIAVTQVDQNICFNAQNIGQEIYHQNSWYFSTPLSNIGKFNIADTNIKITKDCLSSTFIRYHLISIIIHVKIHIPKNAYNHIAQNGIAAYFTSKSKIGDHFAKKREKKNNPHKIIINTHNLVLFNTNVFFDFLYLLLLAKTKNLANKNFSHQKIYQQVYSRDFFYFFNLKKLKKDYFN